jgi:hypothetical protein
VRLAAAAAIAFIMWTGEDLVYTRGGPQTLVHVVQRLPRKEPARNLRLIGEDDAAKASRLKSPDVIWRVLDDVEI